jgi:hypothetical protein
LGLTAGAKLERAQELIKMCAKGATAITSQGETVSAPTSRTELYKRSCIEAILTIDNENDLVKFICRNYYIYDPNVISPRILIASEQNTAKTHYAKIVNDIQKELLDDAGYLAFHDEYHAQIVEAMQKEFHSDANSLALNKKTGFENGIDTESLFASLKERYKSDCGFVNSVLEDDKFFTLMQKLDEKLNAWKRGLISIVGISENKDRFTRSDIIALYYSNFLYVLIDLVECYGVVDLPGIYKEFCDGDGHRNGINKYLEDCRYQKISEKNILDMFVLFSLFLEQLR